MNFAKVDYITQMPNGIITVFGVYGDEEEIDKITGRLKLLWKPETGKLVPEVEKFSSKKFYQITKETFLLDHQRRIYDISLSNMKPVWPYLLFLTASGSSEVLKITFFVSFSYYISLWYEIWNSGANPHNSVTSNELVIPATN